MDSASSPKLPVAPETERADASSSDVYPVARGSEAEPFDAKESSGVVATRPADVPRVESQRAVLRDGVRRAIFGDAPVLAALQVMAREHGAERGLLPPSSEHDFDRLVQSYVTRLADQSRARTFLALTRGEPTGFATSGPSRDAIAWEGEIYALHVHPRFWRTRVPKNLVAACLDFLTQRGFSAARLWVSASNDELIQGLKAQGFSLLEERYHARGGQLEQALVRRLG
jgi:ribosomal protein S18 acetylase RimI-like enzyme